MRVVRWIIPVLTNINSENKKIRLFFVKVLPHTRTHLLLFLEAVSRPGISNRLGSENGWKTKTEFLNLEFFNLKFGNFTKKFSGVNWQPRHEIIIFHNKRRHDLPSGYHGVGILNFNFLVEGEGNHPMPTAPQKFTGFQWK